jgi:hypothetical protein
VSAVGGQLVFQTPAFGGRFASGVNTWYGGRSGTRSKESDRFRSVYANKQEKRYTGRLLDWRPIWNECRRNRAVTMVTSAPDQ